MIAVAATALAIAAFLRRDLFASVLGGRRGRSRAVHDPSPNPVFRVPVLNALWEQRVGVACWTAGTAVLAAFLLSLTTSVGQMLRDSPGLQGYFQAARTNSPDVLILGVFWFGFAGLLVAGFAIAQVARWAAEDGDGRLEMILAQPVSRWRVVLERGLALALVCVLICAVGTVVILLVAPGQHIPLDAARLWIATGLLALLGLSFGALGALVTGRLPRASVAILAVIAMVSYLLPQAGPAFKLPEWAMDISLFRLYGAPLTEGVYWTGLWVMVGIVAVGFGGGLIAMRVRDVAG